MLSPAYRPPSFIVCRFYRLPNPVYSASKAAQEECQWPERLGVEQCADYRPLLEAAGLIIAAYEEPSDWQQHQRALAEGLIAAEAELSWLAVSWPICPCGDMS